MTQEQEVSVQSEDEGRATGNDSSAECLLFIILCSTNFLKMFYFRTEYYCIPSNIVQMNGRNCRLNMGARPNSCFMQIRNRFHILLCELELKGGGNHCVFLYKCCI